jgi:phosphoglycolate phosphatase
LHIAEQLGLSPAELVMIGDGAQDIACAKAAGAHSVGVEGGIQGQEAMLSEGPDVVLKSLTELPAVIERLLNQA